jgi:hypothetical protein
VSGVQVILALLASTHVARVAIATVTALVDQIRAYIDHDLVACVNPRFGVVHAAEPRWRLRRPPAAALKDGSAGRRLMARIMSAGAVAWGRAEPARITANTRARRAHTLG